MKTKLILGLALVLSGNIDAAIVYPQAPDSGKEIVRKYLEPELLNGLKITNRQNLIISDPFATYYGGILVKGKFLSTARLSLWQYWLMDGTNAVAEVALNADTNRYLKFCWMGKVPSGASEAIRIGEQLPQVKKQAYELRYLYMTPYASAIWLHSDSDDIIIPLTDYYHHWNACHPYSESEMIQLLKPVEDERIKTSRKYPSLPD